MPDLAFSSIRLLALALSAILSSTPAVSRDLRTQACEVRPNCKLLVSPTARCESIMDWTGSCSGGFAQGPGAVHYPDATATYGFHQQGRLTGSFVWHRNGLATAIAQYQTQLVSLDAQGNSDSALLACTWDEESESLVERDRSDRKCIEAAAQLGAQAFSPDIWRTFARRMTARWKTPRPPAEVSSRHVSLKALKPVAQSSSRN